MRLSKNYTVFVTVLLSIAIMPMLSACASNPKPSFEAVKQHMIESKKLHMLIHELNTVVYNRPKSELEKDELRRRYALKYAQTIKKVAKNVEGLTYNQRGEKVSEDDIKLYNSFAKRLYKNGEDIQSVVSDYEFENLNNELKKAEETCNACHSKFRGDL